MDEVLIKTIFEYVEGTAETIDGEYGKARSWDEILKDGDTDLIPDFYIQLKRMLK